MRLGRYHLSDCLGGGPTGEVYRAKVYGVAGLDRDFAVKRFHPALIADPKTAGLLHAAARLYGALEHPRVARLQEIGEAGGHTFVATEYVDGVDLQQLMDSDRLPTGTAAQLIVQIGRAVGYAHGRGLSHLGLCPTNVICTVRGDIKVTDFGFLAARLPAEPASDKSLQARLGYLAPEQLEGQSTSPATDVFQLGVIAYQLLVGRKPYRQTGAAALCAAMLREPPAESGLDAPFDKVLKRALARSQFERFPDTGAFADALEAAMRSSPVPGSLADAGKAVSKRQAHLLASRESQASGALCFPIPAPPLAPPSALATPEAPGLAESAFGSMSRLGENTMPGAGGQPFMATPPPFAGDTDVDAASKGGRASSFSDMETIPAHEMVEELPALSENILLGPAGTNEQASPGQFIGGNPGAVDDDEVMTLIREERRRPDSLDDSETIVKEAPAPAAADQAELRSPTELEFTEQAFDDLQSIEDEVSEVLPVPTGAPLAVEVPHLPTPGAVRPTEGPRGTPREIPLPPVQRLPPPGQVPSARRSKKRSGSRPLLLLLVFALVAAGAYLGFGLLTNQDAQDARLARGSFDASSLLPLVDAGARGSAGDAAPGGDDAARTDAGIVRVDEDAGAALITVPSDLLEIDSTPPGAQVYLDGSLVGKTPIKLDPSEDSHRLALILPGYDLYHGDIEGHGLHSFALVEVSMPEGPFGIKVRCVPRNKDRYYIYLDKKPVGQLCPSERLGVDKGLHEIEIYDPITDSRRAFSVVAEDTSGSHRVLVD